MKRRRFLHREPRGTPSSNSVVPKHEVASSNSDGSWHVYAPAGVATILCYLNALDGNWVHDDVPAIVRNKDVLGSTSLVNLFRNDFWGTPMGDLNSHKSYRPLTTLTFRWNHEAAGLSPGWFHGTNVLLHGASSLLVARISLLVAGLQPAFAALAGVLFAAHPVHTEAVTGIVGRADVLACFLFLLSFLSYHGNVSGANRQCSPQIGNCLTSSTAGGSVGHTMGTSDRRHSVWPSILLGGAAMLAKETGVAALLINLSYDLYKSWPHLRRSLLEGRWNEETLHFSRRAAKVLMSFSILLVFRLVMLQGSLPRFSNQDNPAAFHPCRHVRLLTFLYLASLNVWLLLCPAILSHDWQMGAVPLVPGLFDPRNLCTCFLLATCLILLCRCLHECETQRHPWLVLGSLVTVLPFLPASNLVVTVGFVLAERVLYLPSVGFVLLVAGGAQVLWRPASALRPFLVAVITVIVVTFAARTALRNRDWASRESLAKAGLKALPHNAKMHYNFANFLRDTSQLEQAALHYREALRLWPSYASAHNNLGTLMSDSDEAESHFLAAIRFSPHHVNAHYNLGQVYSRRMNRTREAVKMLETCVAIDPSYTTAYVLLARLYASQGRQAAVGRLLSHVARLRPDQPEPFTQLAEWLATTGRKWEALAMYQKALAITPTDRASLLGAARILRAKGQWPRIHQLVTRSHISSRSSRGERVYTGDLYMPSWKLETESRYRDLGEPTDPASKSSNVLSSNAIITYENTSKIEEVPSTLSNKTLDSSRMRKARHNWRKNSTSNRTFSKTGLHTTSKAPRCGLIQHEGPLEKNSARNSHWIQKQPKESPDPVSLRLRSQASTPTTSVGKPKTGSKDDFLCMANGPTEEEFSSDFITG